MGSAIAERIKTKYRVFIFDKDKEKIKKLRNIEVVENPISLVESSDAVILAVKPQDFGLALNEIKDCVKGRLIISIAAGITTSYIEKILGKVRVIRVMPNLPAMIGEGANCLCKGSLATDKDLNTTRKLFKLLGITFIFNEGMMDAVTAVSGSGPGYFYDFLEREKIDYRHIPEKKIKSFSINFKKAAEFAGLNKKDASKLVDVTIRGSLAAISATDAAPATLRDKVASKGGTTEAGLNVLSKGGTLIHAVEAAKKKAEELSKKE